MLVYALLCIAVVLEAAVQLQTFVIVFVDTPQSVVWSMYSRSHLCTMTIVITE